MLDTFLVGKRFAAFAIFASRKSNKLPNERIGPPHDPPISPMFAQGFFAVKFT
jgi:hypothetical protein